MSTEKPIVEKSTVNAMGDQDDVSRLVSHTEGELISYAEVDPALEAKMHLVNNAIDQLGWTGYHTKLFCLNGFGYAVDSLLAFLMSITAGSVNLEFNPSYSHGGQIGLYVGLLIGALFWGISADIIGRKWAFNLSLFVASIAAIIGGASPNYTAWASFIAISGFGAGGNLVLDTTVFLEYLPSSKVWMVPLMAVWWGVGQTVAALLAWAFIPNFSCDAAETCTRANNMGWRYLFFSAGSIVFVMSLARVIVVRFHETPKFLVCKGRDEEVVLLLQKLATQYNRRCDITLEQLKSIGQVTSTHSGSAFSFQELAIHYRGLFISRKLAISTSLVWFSWALIGLIYPLYYVFLPTYLASRGAEFGQTSVYVTWRNYTIAQVCSMVGPLIAGFMCRVPLLGQKYTMAIGALIGMTFFFAYTAVRNDAQNLGFNCAVAAGVNIYYGTLYAYAPTVMPTAHRATGNGTAVAINRVMGIMAAVIATFADTSTPVPIYICAALFAVAAIVSVLFPYEPLHSRVS